MGPFVSRLYQSSFGHTNPLPACFGRGGVAPTVTDAYLIAGYLNPDNFLGGRMSLNRAASAAAMQPLATALGLDLDAAAEACIAVATSNMVASVLPYLARHGVDPEELTLVAFGGNGAIHGPLLAEEIGIRKVMVPGQPSVFCALGGVVTELVHDSLSTVLGKLLTPEDLCARFGELRSAGQTWLDGQIDAAELESTTFEYSAEMRYRGQSFELNVHLPASVGIDGDIVAAENAFHAEHLRLYTFSDPEAPVEFTELRVRVRGALPAPRATAADTVLAARTAGSVAPQPVSSRAIRVGGRHYPATPVYARSSFAVGQEIRGPALIEQDIATVLVPPDFIARPDAGGNLFLEREI